VRTLFASRSKNDPSMAADGYNRTESGIPIPLVDAYSGSQDG
jgi:hypothetical protein